MCAHCACSSNILAPLLSSSLLVSQRPMLTLVYRVSLPQTDGLTFVCACQHSGCRPGILSPCCCLKRRTLFPLPSLSPFASPSPLPSQASVVVSLLPAACHAAVARACIQVRLLQQGGRALQWSSGLRAGEGKPSRRTAEVAAGGERAAAWRRRWRTSTGGGG